MVEEDTVAKHKFHHIQQQEVTIQGSRIKFMKAIKLPYLHSHLRSHLRLHLRSQLRLSLFAPPFAPLFSFARLHSHLCLTICGDTLHLQLPPPPPLAPSFAPRPPPAPSSSFSKGSVFSENLPTSMP